MSLKEAKTKINDELLRKLKEKAKAKGYTIASHLRFLIFKDLQEA